MCFLCTTAVVCSFVALSVMLLDGVDHVAAGCFRGTSYISGMLFLLFLCCFC